MGAKNSCIRFAQKFEKRLCCCCNFTKENENKNVWLERSAGIVMMNGKLANSPEDLSGPLRVRSIDFCLEKNGLDHHTDKFEMMHRDDSPGQESTLVIRRGQSFKLILGFNRPYNSNDLVSFVFSLIDDERPNFGHGTLVGATLEPIFSNVLDSSKWSCTIDSQYGNVLEVLVKASVTAPIGEWKFDIDTQLKSGIEANTFKSPANFYLLFNPWCISDSVYLPDDYEREEYVASDTTFVWRGAYNNLKPSVWKVGQYEKHILQCSLLLITKIGKIRPSSRGDPVIVARALSSVVNSPDDDGAILGNWTDNFSGGTAPTKWMGSVEILQLYFKKRKPVKYGQCWTFAGALATIARAIGIPCRIVTTYSCAHDTQSSLTIDYFVDDKGKTLSELNTDSIWNYHVWNEVWMDRPDLDIAKKTYGGWQAVDATPQEMSNGMYRCGPTSVKAVKFGEVHRPYDTSFLYSEVNADKLFWRYAGPYQPLKLIRKDPLGIGHLISTKAVGRWEREDITHTYKFEEKTVEERDTMEKALRKVNSAFSRFYLNEEFNDIYFDFDLQDDIVIGQTFYVRLQIKNRSLVKSFVVSGTLNVDTVLYTGAKRNEVKSLHFEEEIMPDTVHTISMEVTFNEYFKKLLDQAAFNISCLAKVAGTEYDYFAQDDFRIRKPEVKIVINNPPTVQHEVDVEVQVKNPLPISLRKGTFSIEGTHLSKQLSLKIPDIPVNGVGTATFTYIPKYSGRATFIAKFYSKELDDVDGFLAFEVDPRPEDMIMTTTYDSDGYIRRASIY